MCTNEPESPASERPSTSKVSRTLAGRSQQDLLVILEIVELLVQSRDWKGLIELFSED